MENYYLKPNGEKVYGTTTIWENKCDSCKPTISLYFDIKPREKNDIKRLLCNLGTFLKNVFFK
ncbi:hypothetical protein [Spiroplasma endosymbiont of Aleiodes alternator]|uniref:hypothetical protein n=1 Tax=Spiroplasma endosymbiont of Aleiodes alternator TaxID=3139329 RepID=UPI003CCB3840